ELAEQVATMTEGSPLFAVQLLNEWIARDAFRLGPNGFGLKAEVAELPSSLSELWRVRTDRVLADGGMVGESGRPALEIGVALGREVSESEWRDACHLAGIDPPEQLLPALVKAGLIETGEGRWTFRFGVIREALRAESQEAGRWMALNALCATAIARRYPAGHFGRAERVARHLLEARELDRALAPLIAAIKERRERGDLEQVESLLALHERTLQSLSLPFQSRQWAEGMVQRIEWLNTVPELENARRLADELQAWASAQGFEEYRARARELRAQTFLLLGNFRECLEEASAAADYFRRVDNTERLSNCLRLQAQMLRELGENRASLEVFDEAIELIDREKHPIALGAALRHKGAALMNLNRLDEAWDATAVAEEILAQSGARRARALCLNTLGDLSRLKGETTTAAKYYRASLDELRTLGLREATLIVSMNLSLILIEDRQYSAAEPLLRKQAAYLQHAAGRYNDARVNAMLLPCVANAQDWDAWDIAFRRVTGALQVTGQHEVDLARVLEIAGDVALRAADIARARNALQLALGQWQGCERHEEASRIEQRLAALA
ncbi:MAG: hypothetical protein KC561_09145, partial [Myxococcales bacterium]|nr:hypothetical protein [Myxococcales bacterium]